MSIYIYMYVRIKFHLQATWIFLDVEGPSINSSTRHYLCYFVKNY